MKNAIFYLLPILIAFFSCSEKDELEVADNNQSEIDISAPESGEEAAINAFNEFLESFDTKVATRSTGKPEIVNIHQTRTSKYANTPATRSLNEGLPVYELMLQNSDSTQGFAIVLEEGMGHNVMAYIPYGSIEDTTFNLGLSIWFKELAATSEYISSANSNPLTRTGFHWQNGWETALSPISPQEFVRHLQVGESAQYYFGFFEKFEVSGKYLPTTWGQSAPYNNRVPQTYNNNGVTERCAVGCFAVALGQLASYHRHPAGYNWDILVANEVITNNSPAADEVARLLTNIATMGNTQYSSDGKGGTYPSSNLPTLRNLGYNATEIYYGRSDSGLASILINEMKALRPVVISARTPQYTGHIWVIDATLDYERYYYYTSRVMPSDSPTGYEIYRRLYRGILAHCNWGADGRGDGWYYDFIPAQRPDLHLDYDIYVYTGITPR